MAGIKDPEELGEGVEAGRREKHPVAAMRRPPDIPWALSLVGWFPWDY